MAKYDSRDFYSKSLVFCIFLAFSTPVGSGENEKGLPGDLVYLHTVDPSIRQEIRYAASNNFLGRPLSGYLSADCIVAVDVANALKRAQSLLQKKLSLKVFDCYRPVRATKDMIRWAKTKNDTKKSAYYPTYSKRDLFARSFISARSTHNRGIAVDVTIIDISGLAARAPSSENSNPCSPSLNDRLQDSNLDFGTGFDCFSEKSQTSHSKISNEARSNRELLLHVMTSAGFANYRKEWWHFEYLPLLHRIENYDVPIVPTSKVGWSADNSRPKFANCGISDLLQIVCAAPGQNIFAYEGPSQSSPVSRVLSLNETYECSRCSGPVTLRDYLTFDSIRKTIEPAPWCQLRTSQGVAGWIDAKYLGVIGGTTTNCLEEKK